MLDLQKSARSSLDFYRLGKVVGEGSFAQVTPPPPPPPHQKNLQVFHISNISPSTVEGDLAPKSGLKMCCLTLKYVGAGSLQCVSNSGCMSYISFRSLYDSYIPGKNINHQQ